MKKSFRFRSPAAILALLLICLVLFSGCGKNSDPSQQSDGSGSEATHSVTPEEPGEEMSPAEMAELSERAMQNFLDKLAGGNYVMTAEGYLKTTVSSEDLVSFDYEEDDAYNDFAVMSVNNEVFQGFLEDDRIGEVSYLMEGSALEAAKTRLPNYWADDEVSDGNIYNLFYNDMEDPLKFVSYDPIIQNQVRSFVGYAEISMKYMHEVYLTLDQEDPTVAHIQAEVDDDEVARYYFDDIDVTITFGDAKSDPRAEAWMQDPDYPAARTEWTEADIFIFNSVFLPGYGKQAIPYLPFASYALSVDEENFITDDAVYIRDPHATQEDMDSYIAILGQNGFEAVTEDGNTCYRRVLRDATKCYSSISLEYDNGLNLTAEKYYDFPEYEGLDQINDLIAAHGYLRLPQTDVLADFTATDTRDEQTESWLYFYDYDIALYVFAHYSDYDQAEAYLDAYAQELKEAGYSAVYVDEEGGEVDHYRSEDGSMTFRYHFEDDNETVILLYKAEKFMAASEVQEQLKKAGFPDMDLAAYDSARDHTNFEKIMYGKTYDASIALSMRFETAEEAEAFLDAYVASLEEDDYYRVPPSDLGSNKNNCYTKEEAGLGVAFDFLPGDDGGETFILFDFKSGVDFEAEGDATPMIGWGHLDEITTTP